MALSTVAPYSASGIFDIIGRCLKVTLTTSQFCRMKEEISPLVSNVWHITTTRLIHPVTPVQSDSGR
jgi:hypothetical protein